MLVLHVGITVCLPSSLSLTECCGSCVTFCTVVGAFWFMKIVYTEMITPSVLCEVDCEVHSTSVLRIFELIVFINCCEEKTNTTSNILQRQRNLNERLTVPQCSSSKIKMARPHGPI